MNNFTPLEWIYISSVALKAKLDLLECIDPLSALDARDLTLEAHSKFLDFVKNILEEN